jgi:hypothetical protein
MTAQPGICFFTWLIRLICSLRRPVISTRAISASKEIWLITSSGVLMCTAVHPSGKARRMAASIYSSSLARKTVFINYYASIPIEGILNAGKSILNLVTSSSDKKITPPCSLIIFWHIDSPRPVPPGLVE